MEYDRVRCPERSTKVLGCPDCRMDMELKRTLTKVSSSMFLLQNFGGTRYCVQ